jgi:hypothetical protein
VWEWGRVNDEDQGIFGRECTDTAGMIQKIEMALQQAASGQVPYSSKAQGLLRSELAHRRAAILSSNKPMQEKAQNWRLV